MKFMLTLLLAASLSAQEVTRERLLNAAKEPQNWLTYSGGYAGTRHTSLTQIGAANVKNLELQWVFQANSLQVLETSPVIVDGVMYITHGPNEVAALDARTGRVFWTYSYTSNADSKLCCGQVNRGLAILGHTLFMGTLDAHLIALDARDGHAVWNTQVADFNAGVSLTHAPLIVKDKVLVGTAGGEYGIRGFLAAYSAETGKEEWRFNIIPGPGEPGHETWKNDAWQHGGGSAWTVGSYDPDLNLVYWGTGNPGPDFADAQRPGDNLYTDSVVALDADTGKRKWHFQFTPHDVADWDATQVPVLVDAEWNGRPRKLMLWANRNGFFYVLDRQSGQFLQGKPFIKQNWAKGLDEKGRPILAALADGDAVFPGIQGGTNWYPPSYSARTGLFYIPAWDNYSCVIVKQPMEWVEGRRFMGGRARCGNPNLRRGLVNTWTDEAAQGAVLALDPKTGERKWAFKMHDVTDGGILTTDSDLLFAGGREGYFYALDARTGALLWKSSLGGQIASAPVSYQVDGKQYISISSGHALFTFALRD